MVGRGFSYFMQFINVVYAIGTVVENFYKGVSEFVETLSLFFAEGGPAPAQPKQIITLDKIEKDEYDRTIMVKLNIASIRRLPEWMFASDSREHHIADHVRTLLNDVELYGRNTIILQGARDVMETFDDDADMIANYIARIWFTYYEDKPSEAWIFNADLIDRFEDNIQTDDHLTLIRNCVLKIFYTNVEEKRGEYIKNTRSKKKPINQSTMRTYDRRLEQIVEYDQKLQAEKRGINEADLDEISQKLKINIRARDVLGNVWREFRPANAAKETTYDIQVHAQHAIKISKDDIMQFSDKHPDTVSQEKILGQLEDDVRKYGVVQVIKQQDRIQAFRSQSRQVRVEFGSPYDYPAEFYEATPDLINRKFNLIIPQASRWCYEALKSADQHPHMITFDPDFVPTEYSKGIDQVGGYVSNMASPYWEQYKLPYPPAYHIHGNINNLSLSGFSYINNIKYKNAILEMQQELQEGIMYPHPQLKALLDYDLASFDIVSTIFNHGQQEDILNTTYETRHESRVKLGALIQNQRDRTYQLSIKTTASLGHFLNLAKQPGSEFYVSKVEDHIMEQLRNNQPAMITVNKRLPKKSKEMKKHYYLHAYYLAYHKAAMYEILKLNGYNLDNIHRINIDAIHFKDIRQAVLPPLGEKLGSWRITQSDHIPPAYYMLNLTKEPTTITAVKHNIEDLPTSRDFALHAPPGCGKSYKYTKEFPLPDTLVASFTRELTKKHQADGSDGKQTYLATTMNKYINKDTKRKYHFRCANLIIDDAGMIPGEDVNKAVIQALQQGANRIITYDHIQLPPIEGSQFFKMEFFKQFTVEKLTKYHRYTDEDTVQVMERLREICDGIPIIESDDVKVLCKHYAPYVSYMITILKNACTKYDPKEEFPAAVTLAATRKRSEHLAAYNLIAETIHSTQGRTIDNLIIDVGSTYSIAFHPFLLYVAVSRVRSLKNIRLIY